MKPTALFPFLFFFFLVAFATATVTADVLIDTNLDAVRNGGRYYLMSETGSGFTFSPILNADSCTLAVVDDPINGGRETFLSTPPRVGILGTGDRLNISFVGLASNVCAHKANWVVTRPSLGTANPVMVGSAEEFGDAFVHGWFYIKSYKFIISQRYYYNLVFCVKETECKDVGVSVDIENRRRLVVGDNIKPLVFVIYNLQGRRSFASELSTVV